MRHRGVSTASTVEFSRNLSTEPPRQDWFAAYYLLNVRRELDQALRIARLAAGPLPSRAAHTRLGIGAHCIARYVEANADALAYPCTDSTT